LKSLDDNHSLWSGTPAFAAAMTDAKNAVGLIRGAETSAEMATKGVPEEQAQARNDLEDRTHIIADQLSALAAKNHDVDLAIMVEMTRSSLDKTEPDELAQTARRVSDEANKNIAARAAYRITTADVTALDNARTTFDDFSAISEREGETKTRPDFNGGGTRAAFLAIRSTR
jgi:hypothetical protein